MYWTKASNKAELLVVVSSTCNENFENFSFSTSYFSRFLPFHFAFLLTASLDKEIFCIALHPAVP